MNDIFKNRFDSGLNNLFSYWNGFLQSDSKNPSLYLKNENQRDPEQLDTKKEHNGREKSSRSGSAMLSSPKIIIQDSIKIDNASLKSTTDTSIEVTEEMPSYTNFSQSFNKDFEQNDHISNTTANETSIIGNEKDDNDMKEDVEKSVDTKLLVKKKKPTFGEFQRQLKIIKRKKDKLLANKNKNLKQNSSSRKKRPRKSDKDDSDSQQKKEYIYISSIISKAKLKVICGIYALSKPILEQLFSDVLSKSDNEIAKKYLDECKEYGFGELYGNYEPVPWLETADDEEKMGSFNHKEIAVEEFLKKIQRKYREQPNNISELTKLLFEYFNVFKETYFNINYQTLVAHFEKFHDHGFYTDSEQEEIDRFNQFMVENHKDGHISIDLVVDYLDNHELPDQFNPIANMLKSFQGKRNYYKSFNSDKIYRIFNQDPICSTLRSIRKYRKPNSTGVQFNQWPYTFRFFNNFEVHLATGALQPSQSIHKIYQQFQKLLKQCFKSDNIFIMEEDGSDSIVITTQTAAGKFDLDWMDNSSGILTHLCTELWKIPGTKNVEFEPELGPALKYYNPDLFGKTSAGNDIVMSIHNSGKFKLSGLQNGTDVQKIFDKIKPIFMDILTKKYCGDQNKECQSAKRQVASLTEYQRKLSTDAIVQQNKKRKIKDHGIALKNGLLVSTGKIQYEDEEDCQKSSSFSSKSLVDSKSGAMSDSSLKSDTNISSSKPSKLSSEDLLEYFEF